MENGFIERDSGKSAAGHKPSPTENQSDRTDLGLTFPTRLRYMNASKLHSMAVPPPLPMKPHYALRIGLTAFACALAMICFVGAWYAKVCNSQRKIVSNLEGEVAKRAEPLTLSALAALYPPIPDEQNAAQPLLELWQDEDPEFWKAFRAGKHPLPLRFSSSAASQTNGRIASTSSVVANTAGLS